MREYPTSKIESSISKIEDFLIEYPISKVDAFMTIVNPNMPSLDKIIMEKVIQDSVKSDCDKGKYDSIIYLNSEEKELFDRYGKH